MDWKIINEKYTDFLRDEYESRIPNTDYGADKYKPFFGELFKVGNLVYVTQVTSAKPRHYKIKNSIDFHKIYINNRLVSCVNLNYMFPVPIGELTNLNYSKIDTIINFATPVDKSKYINLLKLELIEINKLSLEQTAINLYHRKYNKPDDFISQRCFDFKVLECAAQEWRNGNQGNKSKILVGSTN